MSTAAKSSLFKPGTSGNPRGRPRGSGRVDTAALRTAFNRDVAPVADELMQRAVERALSGDAAALAGLLGVIAAMAGGQPAPPRQ